MTRFAGIEISSEKINITCVEMYQKKPKLISFESAYIEPKDQPWEDEAVHCLKQLVARLKPSKDKITCSIDLSNVLIRELSTPFKNDDQIMKIYKGELANLIHDYDVDDLVSDYFKSYETEKGSAIVAIGVPKQTIDLMTTLLDKAAIEPLSIDIDAIALFNTLSYIGALDGNSILVVYGSHKKYAKFLMVENGKLCAIRCIRFTLEQTLENNQQIPVQDVPLVIIDSSAGLTELLEKEIVRFVTAYSALTPAKIILAGDFEDSKFTEMLQNRFTTEVVTINLLDYVDNELESKDLASQLYVSFGLALKAADVDQLGLDFRKEVFTVQRIKHKLIKSLTFGSELFLILLLLVGLYLYAFKLTNYESFHKQIFEVEKQLFKDVSSEDVTPDELYDRMKQIRDIELERVGKGSYPIEHSSLKIMSKIYSALNDFYQENREVQIDGIPLYLELERLTIRQSDKKIVIDAKTKAWDFAQKLRDKLARYFSEAEFEGQMTPVEGFIKFSIRLGELG